ncbi:MAG: hypothetical protein ACWA40_05335 [Planktomarina sp.]
MLDPTIPPLIDDISKRLAKTYGVPRSNLKDQVKSIGPILPRKYRLKVDVLAQAEASMAHPKTARQFDPSRMQKAHKAVAAFLETENPDQRRINALRNMALTIVLNLIVVGVLVALAITYLTG